MRRIGRIAAVVAAIVVGAVSARAGEGPEQLAKELRERSRALASLYDRLATEDGVARSGSEQILVSPPYHFCLQEQP